MKVKPNQLTVFSHSTILMLLNYSWQFCWSIAASVCSSFFGAKITTKYSTLRISWIAIHLKLASYLCFNEFGLYFLCLYTTLLYASKYYRYLNGKQCFCSFQLKNKNHKMKFFMRLATHHPFQVRKALLCTKKKDLIRSLYSQRRLFWFCNLCFC